MKMDNSITTRLRNELITFAKMNRKVDYLSLSQVAGYQEIEIEKVNKILEELCTQDHKEDKPILWAIVTDPTEEYYDLLKRLGENSQNAENEKILTEQIAKVYGYWSRRRKTGARKR